MSRLRLALQFVLRSLPRTTLMQLARIIGTVTATVKHRSLERAKLVVVQPLMADRQSPDGDPQLAIDLVSAGAGDVVVMSSDGRLLRDTLGSDTTPARWSLIGLVDDLPTATHPR